MPLPHVSWVWQDFLSWSFPCQNFLLSIPKWVLRGFRRCQFLLCSSFWFIRWSFSCQTYLPAVLLWVCRGWVPEKVFHSWVQSYQAGENTLYIRKMLNVHLVTPLPLPGLHVSHGTETALPTYVKL